MLHLVEIAMRGTEGRMFDLALKLHWPFAMSYVGHDELAGF